MKLRISDMMDQTADLWENQESAVDLERIKKRVLKSVKTSKTLRRRIWNKKTLFLVAAVMILATGSVVIAKTRLPAGGVINKDNQDEVMVDTYASSTSSLVAEKTVQEKKSTKENSKLFSELVENLDAQEIVEIEGKEGRKCISLPQSYLENGCMLVLEKGTEKGFYLEKGQEIVFEIEQSFAGKDTGASLKIRTGYILNGEYTALEDVVEGEDEPEKFVVPESGAYYFTFLNLSSDRVVVQAELLKK
jgi:hypothetical protein